MKIAVIGSGNVGGALAAAWSRKGHLVSFGVRDPSRFKGSGVLAAAPSINVLEMQRAADEAEAILVATPADVVSNAAATIAPASGKIIIDATNAVRGGQERPFEILRTRAHGAEVVKCFNTVGYNIMARPAFGDGDADMFVAGDNAHAKAVARTLALDAGFNECYDVGGADKVPLLESLALLWITLAMQQGYGRDIAFKVMKR